MATSKQATMPLFEEANKVPAAWSLIKFNYLVKIGKLEHSRNNYWNDIRKRFYTRFSLIDDLKAFKNKFTKLKERYKDHKKVVEDNTGLGWDPILCIVDASNELWDDHMKVVQTQNDGFSYSDGEDETNVLEPEVPTSSPLPPFDGNTQFSANNGVVADENEGNINNQFRRCYRIPSGNNRSTPVSANNDGVDDVIQDNVDDQFRHRSRTPSGSSRRGRKENKENEIGETTYVKAFKVLRDKGWRETFIKISEGRRNDWIDSIEDGDF
ncbi:hypothetical protein MKX01_034811 [Papaver californicum]|nr:hypothetical protein MKX01_034811 [Papaver californicum]